MGIGSVAVLLRKLKSASFALLREMVYKARIFSKSGALVTVSEGIFGFFSLSYLYRGMSGTTGSLISSILICLTVLSAGSEFFYLFSFVGS